MAHADLPFEVAAHTAELKWEFEPDEFKWSFGQPETKWSIEYPAF